MLIRSLSDSVYALRLNNPRTSYWPLLFPLPQGPKESIGLRDWNASLDYMWTNFETEISPWRHPSEWLQAYASHVNSIIQQIVTVTKTTEIEQAMFAGDMIYYVYLTVSGFLKCLVLHISVQRLTVYIFAQLMQANDKRYLLLALFPSPIWWCC
jgi:hypothetical protein